MSSLDILTRKNPTITHAWDGKSYSNTESSQGVYDAVVFDETYDCTIQEWTDFTYDAVNLAYGDILSQPPPASRQVLTPTATPTTIAEEKGIDKLGEAWTCNILRAPIKAAGNVIRRRPTVAGVSTSDPTLSSFYIKWRHPRFTRTDLDPDWALFDKTQLKKYKEEAKGKDDSKVKEKELVFVVGDSKMYQKWQSAWLHKDLASGYIDEHPVEPISGSISTTHDVTKQRLKPLEQLATYCRFAETRYGFILTQEEVVVFRVRRISGDQIAPEDARKLHTAFEYKSVPWDAHGTGKLTVNLAIWAIGCMGMNEQHRAMERPGNKPLADMTRLTKWIHDKKQKIYRNVISGREISETDWKAPGMKTSIASIDDAPDGVSLTGDFTVASGLASVTQGVQKVNLASSSSQGAGNAKSTKGAGAHTAAKQSPPQKRPSSSKGAGSADNPGVTSAQTAAKQPEQPARSSSSHSAQRAASPPKKYIVEGTKGPDFVLKTKGDTTYFQKDAKTTIKVKQDSDKKYYYAVPDPRSNKPRRVYLKKI